MKWRNRIVDRRDVPIEPIIENPLNWRVHPALQQRILRELLDEVGWVDGVILNQTTGRLIDGHLRLLEAKRAGETMIPAVIVELTEEEEQLALATLDPLGVQSIQDSEAYQALVKTLGDVRGELRTLIFGQAESAAASGENKPFESQQSVFCQLGDGVSFFLTVDEYNDWRELMYQTVGFSPKDICAEIYRRLGLDGISID